MKKATFLCTLAALAGFLFQPAIGQAADNGGNSASTKSLEERVSQLEKDLTSLGYEMQFRVPKNNAMLDPAKSGLVAITDGKCLIAIGLDDLKPYGNGSEFLLSAINLLGVTLNDVELIVHVEKLPNKSGTAGSPFSTDVKIRSIDPGTQNTVKVRVPGTKPSEIGLVYVYYTKTGGFAFNIEKSN